MPYVDDRREEMEATLEFDKKYRVSQLSVYYRHVYVYISRKYIVKGRENHGNFYRPFPCIRAVRSGSMRFLSLSR